MLRHILVLMVILCAGSLGFAAQPPAVPRSTAPKKTSPIPPLVRAAARGDLAAVRGLLRNRANPNAVNSQGETALMAAAGKGHGEIVKLLLRSGARADVESKRGGNALMAAAASGSTKTLLIVVASGVDATAANRGGETALMVAAQGDFVEMLQMLVKLKANVNARDAEGITALMVAAQHGNEKAATFLLANGAKVDARSKQGTTPLMLAAIFGRPAMLQILLKHRADPKVASSDGVTALMAVAAQGSQEMVKLLLKHGADQSVKDKEGRTAIDWAKEEKQPETVALLQQAKLPDKQKPQVSGKPKKTKPKETTPEKKSPIVVAAGGQGDYGNIAKAVAEAKPGDTIIVRPGSYRGGIVIDKPLTIVGQGPRKRIVLESTDSDCIIMRTDRATVKGLTLRCRAGKGQPFHAVDIPQGALLLEDCDITSNALACVGIHGPKAAPTIRGCWIHDGGDAGLFIFEKAKATVEQCEIFANTRANVAVASGADPLVRNCRIHDGLQDGLFVYDNGRGTFENCDIYRNAGQQVSRESGGKPLLRNCRLGDDKFLSIDTVETNLGDADDEVDPNLGEIILKFSQPMKTDAWFLARAAKKWGQYPELIGDKSAAFRDDRTFVIRVKLKPATKYAFGLNEEGKMHFQSAQGVPLEATIIFFRTAPAAQPPAAQPPAAQPPAETDYMSLFLSLIKEPSGTNYRAVRKLVMADRKYDPYSTTIDDVMRLVNRKRFKAANKKLSAAMPGLMLSPRAHIAASMIAEGLKDERGRKFEEDVARKCMIAILATGDGTKGKPYWITTISDEYDVLVRLNKKRAKQSIVPGNGTHYDVIECADGKQIWFDLSGLYGRR